MSLRSSSAVDLGRRLHARAHVVVERRHEAAPSHAVDRTCEGIPVHLALPRAGIGEHDLRVEAVESLEHPVEVREAVVAEAHLHERAGKRKLMAREALAQQLRPRRGIRAARAPFPA